MVTVIGDKSYKKYTAEIHWNNNNKNSRWLFIILKGKSDINIMDLIRIPGHVLSKSFIGEKYSVTEN